MECTIPLSEAGKDKGMISQIATKGNMNCSWTIRAEPGHYINILVHYNIDDADTNCSSNYLTVCKSIPFKVLTYLHRGKINS